MNLKTTFRPGFQDPSLYILPRTSRGKTAATSGSQSLRDAKEKMVATEATSRPRSPKASRAEAPASLPMERELHTLSQWVLIRVAGVLDLHQRCLSHQIPQASRGVLLRLQVLPVLWRCLRLLLTFMALLKRSPHTEDLFCFWWSYPC